MKDDDLQGRDDSAASNAADDADQTDEQLWAELDEQDADFAAADTDSPDDDSPHGGGDPAGGEGGEPAGGAESTSDGDGQGEQPASDDTKDDPEKLRKQIERLEHALKSEKGRTAKSRREIERLSGQIQESNQRSTQGDDDDPSKREEMQQKLEKAREEFGDVIGPVADQLKQLESRQDQLTAFEERERQNLQGRLDDLVDSEIATFEEEHPDGWETLENNAQVFLEWIEDQPKRLRDLWNDNREQVVDGTGAAYLVSQFKQSLHDAQGEPPAQTQTDTRLQHRRQRQLDGARSARTQSRHSTAMQSGPPDTDDPEKLWEHFERMDKV